MSATYAPTPLLPFTVAGTLALGGDRTSLDAFEVIMDYLTTFKSTVELYDGIAGSFTSIGDDEIDAAAVIEAQWIRNPISARATTTRPQWFEEMRTMADWTPLTGVTFDAADPRLVGGPYDDLLNVWYTFANRRFQLDSHGKEIRHRTGRMTYAGPTQINKVLHLVNPNQFPIFDGVLATGYKVLQRASRTAVLSARRDVNVHGDDFKWEPFRSDLLVNRLSGVFIEVRARLCNHPARKPAFNSPPAIAGSTNLYEWVASNVGDLRLMDMLAWWHFKHLPKKST